VFEELIKIMTFEMFPEDERINFLSNPTQFIEQKIKDKQIVKSEEDDEEEEENNKEEDK
jgi:hypothetical protein